jgi:hypothetical protein
LFEFSQLASGNQAVSPALNSYRFFGPSQIPEELFKIFRQGSLEQLDYSIFVEKKNWRKVICNGDGFL